jgi:hypothetical protein
MTGLIILGALALVMVTTVVTNWLDNRQASSRKDRRQIRAYEEWMADLYALAIQSQGIDPFAEIVAGRVHEFHNNQKGINP